MRTSWNSSLRFLQDWLGRGDQPEKPTVTLLDQDKGAMKWKRPARAAYYRVWMKEEGVDLEFLPVGTTTDLSFMLEKLPRNAEVVLAISALNPGGESALSEPVILTTS